MKKILLIFLLLSNLTYGSFDLNTNINKSYEYILNLEFDEASSILQNEAYQNSSNGFIYLYNNYIDFLTIIITEDLNYLKSREYLKQHRLNVLDTLDNNSPYYLYAKAEIMLQWSLSRLKFEQYYKAAFEMISAFRLLSENQKKFPEFTLNNKSLGVIYSLMTLIPDEYDWILDFIGLETADNFGLKKLDLVLNDSNFVKYEKEILFLLSFLQINLGSDDTIYFKYLERIGDRYQNNILLNFSAARLSHKMGNNDKTLFILKMRPREKRSLNFYYLDYLEGMSYLYMLDYNNAKRKFEFFVQNFEGNNYIKSAYQKLAWIAFLNNNQRKIKAYYSKVILEGNNLIDEDKLALNDAVKQHTISEILLRTRLLYDGGYFDEALLEINKIRKNNFSSLQLEEEYWYRLGRINSKLNSNYNLIIEYYKKVLDLKKSRTYYAPMSALQLGLIFEKHNNFSEAAIYFKECLEFSNFDYQRGIHFKARSGLKRISN